MNNSVSINQDQCAKIGKIVGGLKFRPEFLNREAVSFKADPEMKLRAYLSAAAICHQTHTLINRKLNLKGWEYLEYVFVEAAKNNDKILDYNFILNLSRGDLAKELARMFSEDGNNKNTTLDRIEERSEFLQDVAHVITEKYQGRLENLIFESHERVLNNGSGVYERLSEMKAFVDPGRKKSTIFIELAEDAGMLKVCDQENLVPPMDYHMQRVILRTGCIEVLDNDLKQKLFKREQLDSDEAIRSTAIEAMRLIAKAAERRLMDVDYIFWSLGRSCCQERVLCADKVCNKIPCTFAKTILLDEHIQCIFEKVCLGSQSEDYRRFWQPVVDTFYY